MEFWAEGTVFNYKGLQVIPWCTLPPSGVPGAWASVEQRREAGRECRRMRKALMVGNVDVPFLLSLPQWSLWLWVLMFSLFQSKYYYLLTRVWSGLNDKHVCGAGHSVGVVGRISRFPLKISCAVLWRLYVCWGITPMIRLHSITKGLWDVMKSTNQLILS